MSAAFALIALISCNGEKPQPVVQQPFTAASYLFDSLPEFDIRMVDTLRVIPHDQLGQFLGAGFDEIDKFGPLGLAAARYQVGPSDISVELAQYRSPEDAFGAFSLNRPDGIETEPIGVEAYAVGATLYVANGNIMLTLSAFEQDSTSLARRKLLAEILVSRMPKGDFPGFFLLFPMRWQIKPSYQYYPNDFLGVKGLDHVYTIKYNVDGYEATFFLSEDLSGEKFINLSEYAASIGPVEPAPDTIMFYGRQGIQYDDPKYGHVVTGIVRSKVVGVLHFEPAHLNLTYLWVKGLQ